MERELEMWSLNCTKCGLDVHLGLEAERHTRPLGAHGEPAPHGEPTL